MTLQDDRTASQMSDTSSVPDNTDCLLDDLAMLIRLGRRSRPELATRRRSPFGPFSYLIRTGPKLRWPDFQRALEKCFKSPAELLRDPSWVSFLCWDGLCDVLTTFRRIRMTHTGEDEDIDMLSWLRALHEATTSIAKSHEGTAPSAPLCTEIVLTTLCSSGKTRLERVTLAPVQAVITTKSGNLSPQRSAHSFAWPVQRKWRDHHELDADAENSINDASQPIDGFRTISCSVSPHASPPVADDSNDGVDDEPVTRPPYSYAALAYQAIVSASPPRLTSDAIIDWIAEQFCFYSKDSKAWQRHCEHVIQSHVAFVNINVHAHKWAHEPSWVIDTGRVWNLVNIGGEQGRLIDLVDGGSRNKRTRKHEAEERLVTKVRRTVDVRG